VTRTSRWSSFGLVAPPKTSWWEKESESQRCGEVSHSAAAISLSLSLSHTHTHTHTHTLSLSLSHIHIDTHTQEAYCFDGGASFWCAPWKHISFFPTLSKTRTDFCFSSIFFSSSNLLQDFANLLLAAMCVKESACAMWCGFLCFKKCVSAECVCAEVFVVCGGEQEDWGGFFKVFYLFRKRSSLVLGNVEVKEECQK